MGGEKADIDDDGLHYKGSPPRGRGKGGLPCRPHLGRGITPAWAGKSLSLSGWSSGRQDYPRVGGEK